MLDLMNELVVLLEFDNFGGRDDSFNPKIFKSSREILLLLLEVVVKQVEIVEENTYDASNCYKILVAVVKRREFDAGHLHLDVNNRPTCTSIDLTLAQRYRKGLLQIQLFVNKKLSRPFHFNRHLQLYLFCSKLLAISFFRLPLLSTAILDSLRIPSSSFHSLLSILALDYKIPWASKLLLTSSSNTASTTTTTTTTTSSGGGNEGKRIAPHLEPGILASLAPELFQWNSFHEALTSSFPLEPFPVQSLLPKDISSSPTTTTTTTTTTSTTTSAHDGSMEPLSKSTDVELPNSVSNGGGKIKESSGVKTKQIWTHILTKKELFFWIFFKEYLHYVSYVAGKIEIEWIYLHGFLPMLMSFIEHLKRLNDNTMTNEGGQQMNNNQNNKYLQETIFTLIHCDSYLITYFLPQLFNKTNAYDINSVLDTLSIVDSWFIGLQTQGLPSTFDVDYFCKAVTIIISTDHHQTITKLLTVIYNNAQIFRSQIRKNFFSELIQKHFFTLFLHWDDNVRNAYQQILVFKLLRKKRSMLYCEGMNVNELSSLDAQSIQQKYAEVTNGSLYSSPSKTEQNQDKEASLDMSLFTQVEIHVKMIQEQIRNPKQAYYNKSLESYVPKALSEYKMYMSRYYAWERSGEEEPPKLVPMYVLHNLPEFD